MLLDFERNLSKVNFLYIFFIIYLNIKLPNYNSMTYYFTKIMKIQLYLYSSTLSKNNIFLIVYINLV